MRERDLLCARIGVRAECVRCVSASGLFPESFPLLSPLATSPAQGRQDGCETALVGGAKPVSLVETERRLGDLQDRGPLDPLQVHRDQFFPRVTFIAGGLLGNGVLSLELAIRPPWDALLVKRDRLGKELIAILRQRLDVDAGCLYRPEPPAAGFIAQVGVAIRGADENNIGAARSLPAGHKRDDSARRARLMNDFNSEASALFIACISATSINHLPRKCCDTSLPAVTSGKLSLNHSPPSTLQAVDFMIPCGPSSTIIWSA